MNKPQVKKIPNKDKLLPAYLKAQGLIKHHILSYNYFIDKGLDKIMRAH